LKLNVGIVGFGNIGKIHYRIYKQINQIKKIYIVDTDRKKIAYFKDDALSDYKKLLGKVDLVSIAAPTPVHFEISKFFLGNRIPVLVEKPLTSSLTEANKLISLSTMTKTLLFAGHVERYNSAYLAIRKLIRQPKFIECHRLSPYPQRSLDVSVVLDLMIHDLDIILDIVRDKVKKIEATGIKVLSGHHDIANVRITFQKGCITNITASRVSREKIRKIRVFFLNHYISLDYANQEAEIYKKVRNKIIMESLKINKEEPLRKEIEEFVKLAKHNIFQIESALSAKRALELAVKIQKIINRQ